MQLVELWAKATNRDFEIKRYPFKRSFYTVINFEADFHLPLLMNPNKSEDELNFDYSSSVIFCVNFVLYTSKEKKIDSHRLGAYRIYTDGVHVDLFDFKIQPDYRIENASRKLDSGRIDGYIFADVETNPILRNLGLKNIRRAFYKTAGVHAVLPKGEKGGETDRTISADMENIRQSGEWAGLMNPVYHEDVDWQP